MGIALPQYIFHRHVARWPPLPLLRHLQPLAQFQACAVTAPAQLPNVQPSVALQRPHWFDLRCQKVGSRCFPVLELTADAVSRLHHLQKNPDHSARRQVSTTQLTLRLPLLRRPTAILCQPEQVATLVWGHLSHAWTRFQTSHLWSERHRTSCMRPPPHQKHRGAPSSTGAVQAPSCSAPLHH